MKTPNETASLPGLGNEAVIASERGTGERGMGYPTPR